MPRKILVALGGNALKQADEEGSADEQRRNCATTCAHLARIIKSLRKDERLIITHGNGPQVGNLIVQQEAESDRIPTQTMDILGAMTQGQIGYMLLQSLQNCLRDIGSTAPVCAIVNQVLVNKNDSEFLNRKFTKPVGNFFTKEEAKEIEMQHPDYILKKVKPTGDRSWRRCVPSPDPIVNVEAQIIKKMVEANIVVIASGGGGIPVVLDQDGHYKGVEAVIDKDLAGEKLAETVEANIFLILTDIEKVKLNFGKPNEKDIDEMSIEETREFLEQGHFLSGSMEPKVRACLRFVEWGGEKAIITSLDKAIDALEGKTGTLIHNSKKPSRSIPTFRRKD